MIDSEFERKGREMSDELNQIQPIPEVDLEYTWPSEPLPVPVCLQVASCNGAVILALEKRIAELERDNANQANLLDALRETIGQMEHEARTMKSKVCGHEFEHDGWPPDELCPDCYFEKEDTDEVWYAGQEAVERQNKERAAVLSRAT